MKSHKSLLTLAVSLATFAGAISTRAQDAPGGGPSSVEAGSEGKEIYETICQACHMADAKGGGGAGAVIPALADNKNLADKDFFVGILLKGRGGMPWFNDMLSQKQIAAVATYVRSHFNTYPEVITEADVKRVAAGATASPRDCATC